MIRQNPLRRAVLPGLLALLLTSTGSQAQQSYPTAEDAASALAAAVKGGPGDILKVLGKSADDIVSSGDDVADADLRQRFLSAYDAKHSIKAEGKKKAALIVGPDDFPFPIPLVNTRTGWEFDTDEGRHEVLYRRIGRNELDAIQTCLAFVDAENDYADKNPAGSGNGVYAQRIVSSPGKKDGLFWPSSGGDESPLGEFAAKASAEGYKTEGGPQQPYHGYYYRILTRQGPDALGGAFDYVVGGKMIGGFALIAYPADYGNSGVMTFLVNHNGKVYQQDLGPRSSQRAFRMSAFNPDPGWKQVSVPKP
jgi:hypothetical protein